MGRGGMTRVLKSFDNGKWTVQIRRHKTTGGTTVYISGPGILSATLPIETAFTLTELLDDACDWIEDTDAGRNEPTATVRTAGDVFDELNGF